MAVTYISSPEKDFSSGIDVRSSENQIDPGFVRDLLNADVVEKRVRKRQGYQGFAGDLPVRVTKVDYETDGTQVCFTLDESISLESVRSSPIVVYGRSSPSFSPGDGPFDNSTDHVKYYPSFTVPLRKIFAAGTGTVVITADETGLSNTNAFVGVVESTSITDRSYSDIITNSTSISESSFDITLGYTTVSDRKVFVYVADESTGGGNSYVFAAPGTPTGIQTLSIPTSTHNLSNFNIIAQVQQDIGFSRIRVIPDSVTIDTSGNVSVVIDNETGFSQDYYVLLSAAPLSNITSGNIGSSASGSVVIPSPTSPWIFFGIYLQDPVTAALSLVYPDSLSFDDTTDEITITFENDSPTAAKFVVYYEYGSLRSNQICVTDASVTATETDDRPQLTIWGLLQSELYSGGKADREGWVTHIDSYRRSGEERLVSGLGGDIYTARTYEEAGAQYDYAILYPNLSSRISTAVTVAPLFWNTGEVLHRSRGYITAEDSGAHLTRVTGARYDASSGLTQYTLAVPNKLILDSTGSPTSLSSVISVAAGLEDYLDVSDMSFSAFEGSYKIKQIQDGVDEILLWVENPNVDSSDYDDDGTYGFAGVFTDQLTWASSSPYVPGDVLLSAALDSSEEYEVTSSSGATTVVTGVVDLLSVAAGVSFLGERTSSVVPTRNAFPEADPSVVNLVRGDMISYTGIPRLLRVLYINPDSTRTVNITSDGTTATVVLTSGDTSYLTMGQSVLLTQAGVYTGSQQVTAITSGTSFQFATEEVDSVSGASLPGGTMEVDEELTWNDSLGDTTGFVVEDRWIPAEAPDDSYNLTPSTHVQYLNSNLYQSQPTLRSSMLASNMYFTNGDDATYKFDGTSLYRAGIIPWQPGAFLTQDTSGATIVIDIRAIAYSAISAAEGTVTIGAADQQAIPTGTAVRLDGSTETYTVRDYQNDGTNYYLLLDRSLDANVTATGSVTEIGTYRYYYRLNAVDLNNNIVASAVTGYQDHIIELTGNAAVQHKLVGLPAWDNYDYEQLEVQIYRTKLGLPAPFYLVTTLKLDFDNTLGYISFRDSFADSDLNQLDVVSTALKGTELGLAWSDPLRSKYITSIGNRLVQGNIQDYPELDIQIVGDGSVDDSTFDANSLLFRRSNIDTGTTTDNLNRVRFEWKSATTGAAGTYAILTDQFSFTATDLPGTVAANDWIYLSYSTVATSGRDPYLCGWYQIAAVTDTTVTVNLVGATAAGSYPDQYTIATDSRDVPVLMGVDGNLGGTTGNFPIFDAGKRMAIAINAHARMVDVSLAGQSAWSPWLTCRGGNDETPAGHIVIRQPRADTDTMEVVPTFSGYSLFINSVRRDSGEEVPASTRIYPSRILISYENYPEIIDNPTSVLDTDSDSAIDVNPADGQEITGIIPFFGDATFTAAQQAAILVVFKTNSIYLVDLNQKALGNQAVQRLETEGLGCTAPYSISTSKNGIVFANISGIYILRPTQLIEYLGRYMERNWNERVDLSRLDLVQGHHFGLGRSFKLSVPLLEDVNATTGYLENSEVYVYNHTGETLANSSIGYEGKPGAWGRYDNHPATGWANLSEDAYFGTTGGRVFSLRNTGTVTDYRDDNQAIDMVLDTRANDFGSSGIRKVIDRVVIHYRTPSRNTGTTVSYSVDMETEYSPTTQPVIPHPSAQVNGMSDFVGHEIETLIHNVNRRRCIYFQIRVENATIDESIEVAGIDFKVGGLTDKGILSAKNSQSK